MSDADLRRQNSVAGSAPIDVSSNGAKKDKDKDAEKEEKLPKPPRCGGVAVGGAAAVFCCVAASGTVHCLPGCI